MSHEGIGHSLAEAHHAPPPHGILEQVAHHMGLVLTLSYVLLSAVGVVFESLLLQHFQTDFLTYAEPEDFLMAGLRHPIVLGFVALSISILGIFIGTALLGTKLSNRYAAFRARMRARPLVRIMRPIALALGVCYYFFVFTYFYAKHEAAGICSGEEPMLKLEFVHYGSTSDLPAIEGYLVAITGRYMFFFDKSSQQLRVIPVNSVGQIITSGKHEPSAGEHK